jgi:hypothetical protein
VTLTVHVPDDLAGRLASEAARRGMTVDEFAVALLGQQVAALEPAGPVQASPGRRRLPFIGVGDSGASGGDIARRHDEIRRDAFIDRTAAEA